MFNIFVPVFESVWKRKEAKIYIGFAVLYPVLLLISTLLPEGSNFLVPSTAEGLYFSYDVTYSLVLPLIYDFVLPVLALFYLTCTVFKGEADSHTMFLYKDINRS